MAVRTRVINGPTAASEPVIATEAATAITEVHGWRIHEPGELPFRLVLMIRGQRKVVVFHPRNFTPGPLKSEARANEANPQHERKRGMPQAHSLEKLRIARE